MKHYYLITDEPLKQSIRALLDQVPAGQEALQKFTNKWGILAIGFNEKPMWIRAEDGVGTVDPDRWEYIDKKTNKLVPNRSNPKNAELCAEWDAIHIPGHRALTRLVTGAENTFMNPPVSVEYLSVGDMGNGDMILGVPWSPDHPEWWQPEAGKVRELTEEEAGQIGGGL